jgi:uncharacterized membrane protein
MEQRISSRRLQIVRPRRPAARERKFVFLHRVSHKVGWFVGTIYFVIIRAVFVLLWLLWNAFAVRSFDPYPFPLLSAVLALEAVLLTSFVLIRQNSTFGIGTMPSTNAAGGGLQVSAASSKSFER